MFNTSEMLEQVREALEKEYEEFGTFERFAKSKGYNLSHCVHIAGHHNKEVDGSVVKTVADASYWLGKYDLVATLHSNMGYYWFKFSNEEAATFYRMSVLVS